MLASNMFCPFTTPGVRVPPKTSAFSWNVLPPEEPAADTCVTGPPAPSWNNYVVWAGWMPQEPEPQRCGHEPWSRSYLYLCPHHLHLPHPRQRGPNEQPPKWLVSLSKITSFWRPGSGGVAAEAQQGSTWHREGQSEHRRDDFSTHFSCSSLSGRPLANGKQCALFKVINIWEMLFLVRVGFFIVIVFYWIQVLLWVSFILFIIHVSELNWVCPWRKEKSFRFLDLQYHLRTIRPSRIRSQEASYLYAALFL